MEIWELGATRQAAAIRSRELSSREVVSAHLGAAAAAACPRSSDRFIPIGRRGRRAQGRGYASAMTAATR